MADNPFYTPLSQNDEELNVDLENFDGENMDEPAANNLKYTFDDNRTFNHPTIFNFIIPALVCSFSEIIYMILSSTLSEKNKCDMDEHFMGLSKYLFISSIGSVVAHIVISLLVIQDLCLKKSTNECHSSGLIIWRTFSAIMVGVGICLLFDLSCPSGMSEMYIVTITYISFKLSYFFMEVLWSCGRIDANH